MIVRETWECHDERCVCSACQPAGIRGGAATVRAIATADAPQQALFTPLAPDEPAPRGWRKVRRAAV